MEKHKNNNRYKPNSYPLNFRIVCLCASVALVIYAVVCIYYDDFYIPGKRRGFRFSGDLHVHGYSVWILSLACLTTAANLLSYFIDHYDNRNNEHKYERFSKLSARAGWFLLFSAIILELVRIVSKSL